MVAKVLENISEKTPCEVTWLASDDHSDYNGFWEFKDDLQNKIPILIVSNLLPSDSPVKTGNFLQAKAAHIGDLAGRTYGKMLMRLISLGTQILLAVDSL